MVVKGVKPGITQGGKVVSGALASFTWVSEPLVMDAWLMGAWLTGTQVAQVAQIASKVMAIMDSIMAKARIIEVGREGHKLAKLVVEAFH